MRPFFAAFLLLFLCGECHAILLNSDTFESVFCQWGDSEVIKFRIYPSASQCYFTGGSQIAVFIFQINMRKLFVVYKNPDTVTAYFHFHFVPLSRHGVKAQRTDSHEFVCTHISGTHQVEIVLQPAFDTYHITVKAVMCTEACPYLYLFGVFRGTCLERQGIIFPLRIAEEGTTSHSIQWLGGIGEIIAPYGLILGLRCQTGQATGAS